MRAVIIPGSRDHLRRIVDRLGAEVVGVVVHEHVSANDPALRDVAARTAARVITLSTLSGPANLRALSGAAIDSYERCLWTVLEDVRSHILATRARFDSTQNNIVAIEAAVGNAVLFLEETQATCVVCSSTPHSLEAWVLARCAEIRDIPVYLFEQSPVRDRAWILSGVDAQEVVRLDPGVHATDEPSADVLAQVAPQMNARAGERDSRGVPVSRQELGLIPGAETNAWWSLRREVSFALGGGFARAPLRVAQSFFKYRLHRAYQARVSAQPPKRPYVVFFLHYQPERTTLPEGLRFCQQLLAIRVLSLGLPAEWSVVVREHPTTWLKPGNHTVRRTDYYDRLCGIDKVRLCSMDVDTFALIDEAEAVATLTGKVGFQAIVRGKPALVFGTAGYKDHPGCLRIRTARDVATAVDRIAAGELAEHLTRQSLMRYLAWVERQTVRADPASADLLELRLRNFERLYEMVLSGQVDLSRASYSGSPPDLVK